MTKIKQPKFRFKGYIADWEHRKLGEVAKFNPKSQLPDEFEYVDLESVVGTSLISHRTENKENAPSRAKRLAEKGDVFFQTVRPYQKNNYLFDMPYDNYVFSTGYAQLRPYVDSYFLLSRIQEERFVGKVLDKSTGTSYPAINSTDLAQITITIPSVLDEQEKIGEFFKTLDDTISLHEKKLEVTKQFKQTMLKKMFPRNGEIKPEIRFKGFTEDWKKCKLNDVFELSSGEFLIKSKQIINGEYPVYNGGVSNTGYTNDYNFESNDDGDIIISSRGSAGSINLVKGKYWLGNSCFTLNKYKQEIYIYFILSSIYNKQNDLIKTIQKGTIPSLSKSDILKLNIFITNIREQKLIGEYFKELDNQIKALEQKLETYKEFKKAMLQKMFI